MRRIDHLQQTIKKRGLKRLTDHFGVKVKTHPDYSNLHQFKYDQIASPKDSPAVQACRGIVLDADRDWAPACYVFDRFFNYGQPEADDVNLDTAQVQEKVDGSLIQMFHYDGRWQVTTSGTPSAEAPVGDLNMSFRDLFWRVWTDLGYKLPDDTNLCFSFELMTKYNRVVILHDPPRIVLHGVRDLSDLGERDPAEVAKRYGWEYVWTHPLQTWDEILEQAKTINPLKSEGFVVVDDQYNRVKIKSPKYVAMAHFQQVMSPRKALEIIRSGEDDEFMIYMQEYDEYLKIYEEVKSRFNNLRREIEERYREFRSIGDDRAFADNVKHLPYAGALFGQRRGKLTVEQYLADMNIKKLEAMLRLDEVSIL